MTDIHGNTKNEIRSHWAQKGYWKQSLAMRLSYKLGSLATAWSVIKQIISGILHENKMRVSQNEDSGMGFMDWAKTDTRGQKMYTPKF